MLPQEYIDIATQLMSDGTGEQSQQPEQQETVPDDNINSQLLGMIKKMLDAGYKESEIAKAMGISKEDVDKLRSQILTDQDLIGLFSTIIPLDKTTSNMYIEKIKSEKRC